MSAGEKIAAGISSLGVAAQIITGQSSSQSDKLGEQHQQQMEQRMKEANDSKADRDKAADERKK
jgi:hypothetical protein